MANAEAVPVKVHVLIPERIRHTSVTTQRADTTAKTAASTQTCRTAITAATATRIDNGIHHTTTLMTTRVRGRGRLATTLRDYAQGDLEA